MGVSDKGVERALARQARPGAVLAREDSGASFAVFPNGDRRRRVLARLSAEQVRALQADGVIEAAEPDVFVASRAGLARIRRADAGDDVAFLAQHAPIGERKLSPVTASRSVRALNGANVVQRLAGLLDGKGAPWLSAAELRMAAALRADWEASQAGLVRGSDWTAPPLASGARGASNAQERAAAARCDARKRLGAALDLLAQPLRRAVERVCLNDEGIEALEQGEGWPARSGKVALKLALAQLVAWEEAANAARASS